MLRDAVTALVVIASAVVITLVVTRQGHVPGPDPTADLGDAQALQQQCWEPLLPLAGQLAEALGDNERFAKTLGPNEGRCTAAEVALEAASRHHPGDAALAKLREQNTLAQKWLRDISTAFAAYQVAEQRGSASTELEALKALLQ